MTPLSLLPSSGSPRLRVSASPRLPLPLLGVLLSAWTFTGVAASGQPVWPDAEWTRATPAEVGMDPGRLNQARDYALTGGGAGGIVRHGRLVISWGNLKERFDLKSTTKSFGSIALGLALDDGLVRLSDRVQTHLPEVGLPQDEDGHPEWLGEITVLQLASQTAGFEKPGGSTRLLFRPGTQWDYSDSGPNWLADCLTVGWRRDLAEVMADRVLRPIGIGPEDLTWRANAYRPKELRGIPRREFGSGILANVDALARVGYLMLQEGRWQNRTLLSANYVHHAPRVPAGHQQLEVRNPKDYGQASHHYGLLWWNNQDGTLPDVPRDAFWSWGLYDSLIVVIPSLDLVAARAGQSWARQPDSDHYAVLHPFLQPLARAVLEKVPAPKSQTSRLPPPSPVFEGIDWAPPSTIQRYAQGSDNWPLTEGDDGWLYTAYGDGRGFEPFVPEKLSLGLARLRGDPENLVAENLRAPTLEKTGDGARGRKASGLLMVDRTLYLWARNAGNSRLAWSTNHGTQWTWADWSFTESFGCPTFLNFGPNYRGARDAYVYVYSPDADTAYERADRMVLARAPKNRLRERDAWEFLERLDDDRNPVWTSDLSRRGAVFESPGRCYRSSVSYHVPLSRYLWVQTGPGDDPRFAGGLAVFDAPEPWGPWTTVFATDAWDVGPGETASFPTRWMSQDGSRLHLVSSGDDAFSVRAATLRRRSDPAPAASLSSSPIRFERRVLTDRYLCDGITAGDLDHDGHADIVAGPFWYPGPTFAGPRAFYPPSDFDREASPTDSLFSHVHDFNGDGWPDILVLGRVHLHQAFWYENPQGAPGSWPKHFAFHRVQGENPPFTDVDGDGRPELVAHWQDRWGLIQPDWSAPTAPWRFVPLTASGTWHHFYHGEGVGDLNGDGRPDLLLNEGWYEQPATPGREWPRHEFRFAEKGGAQMFTTDVDGDGDQDVITALDAHGWGLAWFEQRPDDARGPRFRRHLIMGNREEASRHGVAFSQPHALALGDLDGDGLPDLVVGKRRWAHGPTGDIEPMGDPVLYWFRLVRGDEGGTARFEPHLIDTASGVGLQITLADVNGDQRLDILTASKLGAFVFVNHRR